MKENGKDIWECLEGGKRREICCDYVIISKITIIIIDRGTHAFPSSLKILSEPNKKPSPF